MKLWFSITLAILVIASGLLSSCSPQPDARLIQFQQMKLAEPGKVTDLQTDLHAEMQEANSELERLDAAFAVSQFTAEKQDTLVKIDELHVKISQLNAQWYLLLAIKQQYLKQDIEEIKLYTKLAEYHEFKLSQLNDINARLIEMRINIDQKTLLRGDLASATQEYNRLLVQRQLIQHDIEQLEQLLGKD